MRTYQWVALAGLAGLAAAAACGDDESIAPAASASGPSSVGPGPGTGVGGTSASSGGGGMQPCIDCLTPLYAPGGECEDELNACLADNTCMAWVTCFNTCMINDQTPPCFVACDNANAAAANLFGPFEACMCNPCTPNCSFFCGSMGVGGTGPGGAGGAGGAGGN